MSSSTSLYPHSPPRPISTPLPETMTNTISPKSFQSSLPYAPIRPSPLSPASSSVAELGSPRPSTASPGMSSSAKLLNAVGVKLTTGGKVKPRILGIQDRLKGEIDGVVKRRQGGVLARGFILKTGMSPRCINIKANQEDHYPTGRALDLDLTISGAPNFRAPDEQCLNVFGVAQPTIAGLRAILTILGCHPSPPAPAPSRRGSSTGIIPPGAASVPLRKGDSDLGENEPAQVQLGRAAWFSTREETLIYCNGRPYVLRDASDPFRTLTLSDRAPNLEDIERRFRLDVLEEARRYGGMILIHDEVTDGNLVPTWISVDEETVFTPRDIWHDIKAQGWRCDYWRIPVAPDRSIEDNYLDAYVNVLKTIDPVTTSLVFNCGMGVVRTTFGMCAALIIRRKQFLLRSLDDPFPVATGASGFTTVSFSGQQAAQFLEQATHQQTLNKSLLRLTRILDRNLASKHNTSAVDLLSSHPALLEQLRKAHMGNYGFVLSLLSSLDHGRQMKRLVDAVIDSCDAVVNLRESVIENRIKYSVATLDDKTRQATLEKASRSLEQYFDLIAFAEYVEEEDAGATGVTFHDWLKNRPEIWNQIKTMRRQGGNRLFAFAPINDLSLISRSTDFEGQSRSRMSGSRIGDVNLQGGKILGDEWADYVVKNRNGIMLRASTLLKSDLWLTDAAASVEGVRGAVGFRQVRGGPIFATGQPTQDAIYTILDNVHLRLPGVSKVVWVCLREEPLVMINGSPYCLRRDSVALRNMRDYSGVSASRLEVLEERLKSDVVNELAEFQGRVLLHSESSDGQVIPVWESVDKGDVASIREVMDQVAVNAKHVGVEFVRIPITSESSPDFHDITDILNLCLRTDLEKSAFILNDQLGRGRSSNTAVIVLLIQRWLKRDRSQATTRPTTPMKKRPDLQRMTTHVPKTSWQIINSCLRVIRNGLEVKKIVDEAIDRTAAHYNLRDAIEDVHGQAESAPEGPERNRYVEKGVHLLRRYYHLLLFQAYLDDRGADDENPYTFESFVKHRPVFKTLETELERGGLQGLTPIERVDPAQGMALPDEETQVVANRSGAILSAQTILKSDFFSGLQKQSLPERVEGAANYRKIPLLLMSSTHRGDFGSEHYVYGTGYWTWTLADYYRLRNALEKMGASPKGSRKIVWTSLREEPVLYVKSRPHVLRIIDKPLTNVETTGVTASVVERMETTLKDDVLREIRRNEGRLLLHDEIETKPGTYEIIPIWEDVEEDEVMTPKELYDRVIRDGYRVDYQRVAITDEQAPLPATLQVLVNRIAQGMDDPTIDFVFNCQMGRGRTTTGMIVASLVATIDKGEEEEDEEAEEMNCYTT
ncbi:hypothetical protein M231_06380 [Tremella mesenterica]|uniref:Inositol hexakisphosphate-domain-containing protein n=1 Tax=Tremella mesenterica TaxID=5217 RepID=A0A4Q1BGD3_TREME|nr:hypothetical protein M231_06380 [Tremella mesenterica]